MSLRQSFRTTLQPQLKETLGSVNINATPKLTKIIVSIGLGSRRGTNKIIDIVTEDLARITGQRPSLRAARKAIAGFKVRIGETVGVMVTLRGQRMYDFLERLIHIVLPRIRDFRGLPLSGFDGHGNYTLGIREHTVFPEIDQERVAEFYGLGITFSTTATTNEQAEALLRSLGLPLKQHVTESTPQGPKEKR